MNEHGEKSAHFGAKAIKISHSFKRNYCKKKKAQAASSVHDWTLDVTVLPEFLNYEFGKSGKTEIVEKREEYRKTATREYLPKLLV